MTSPTPPTIPVLLLKTRSQPRGAYEEYFAGLRDPATDDAVGNGEGQAQIPSPVFLPEFVPVLEHRPNTENLGRLEELFKSGRLCDHYGGMIFTSQRAVEAWAELVKRVEQEVESNGQGTMNAAAHDAGSGVTDSSTQTAATHGINITSNLANPSQDLLDDDFTFPLYTVGPATSRALTTLVTESSSRPSSAFTRLRPATFGEHTGNGDALALYILHHYNTLHSQRVYTFYEAPRLPFTPLIGPPRGERVEKDDARLKKKPLLFLVGEQRRDIIPRTLTDKDNKLPPEERIQVDEVEVYVTATRESFQADFWERINVARERALADSTGGGGTTVVVVFSPQGCEAMLHSLGFLDQDGKPTPLAERRRGEAQPTQNERSTTPDPPPNSRDEPPQSSRCIIIATIGPTTRDYLKSKFGFDADVCASKPSPQGVGAGILDFLRGKAFL